MNALDIFIIILLLISGLSGMRQGLIRALANLIGWFLAITLAIRFNPQVQPLMAEFTSDPIVQKVASFASIIFCMMLLVWLVGRILQTVLKQMELSWFNRMTGGLFGLLKSVIVVLVLIHGLAPWLDQSRLWHSSKFIEILSPYSEVATMYTQKVVQRTAEELEMQHLDE